MGEQLGELSDVLARGLNTHTANVKGALQRGCNALNAHTTRLTDSMDGALRTAANSNAVVRKNERGLCDG